MSDNKVWVTWEDPYNVKPLACKVQNLANKADIDDLTQAFVKQRQGLNIDHAAIEVREREGGDRLREDFSLQPYFMRNEDENNDNPGRSRRTALFLTLPSSSTSTLLRSGSRVDGLRPGTPGKHISQHVYVPPSTGKAAPSLTHPQHPPSSNDGKEEGLGHAVSDDVRKMQRKMLMQCTSTPAAVELLQILEKAIEDQQNGSLEQKFTAAANYVLLARHRLSNRKVPEDMGTNERFYTGAMANALNAILEDGYCVLHQACLGKGSTHSDLSAIRINHNNKMQRAWPATLMVGEGKWQPDSNLRDETRGQILNELLRHRAIDEQSKEDGSIEMTFGPILLFAFDKQRVEVDLAFPSTKGGKLEMDRAVSFPGSLSKGKEMFWTLRILRISMDDAFGSVNLPLVLRFISDALQKLDAWSKVQGRVQQKMPMPLTFQDEDKCNVQYCGENVTIIEATTGSKFVYKEYCYHLRQASDVMTPLMLIKDADKRQPPPADLLKKLGSPYSDEWIVTRGPFGTSVLRYPFIEGTSYSPTIKGWLMILRQIRMMHEIDFVHGDLLPRNVLFDHDGQGYVIDFDLTRKGDKSRYVDGYNYEDFQEFRHTEAKASEPMSKDHDLHSLRKMSLYFFDVEQSVDLDALDLDGLVEFFRDRPDLRLGEGVLKEVTGEEGSGSPNRTNVV